MTEEDYFERDVELLLLELCVRFGELFSQPDDVVVDGRDELASRIVRRVNESLDAHFGLGSLQRVHDAVRKVGERVGAACFLATRARASASGPFCTPGKCHL